MLRIAPYRSLAAVYALVILAGICESRRKPANIYGDVDRNYPDAMARLYQGRAETDYLLGLRFETVAGQLFNREMLQRDPKWLPQSLTELKVNLRRAARHYERALAAGLKSEEDLHYNYALTLIRIQAEPERIDRAIATWRHHFPHSGRPDLDLRRQSIEKQIRQLPSETASPVEGEDSRSERQVIENRSR